MKKYFSDLYGSTASIKQYRKRFHLRIRDSHGTLFHDKTYSSYLGARIALGKNGEGWRE